MMLRCLAKSLAPWAVGAGLAAADVHAAVILSENFEGTANVFGAPTFGYAEANTGPHALTPSGGSRYGYGGAGVIGVVSSNVFAVTGLSLLSGEVTGLDIDEGLAKVRLYAQFSTYLQQNDYAEISVTFRDTDGNLAGGALSIGSIAFTSALGTPGSAASINAREWGAQEIVSPVPPGARTVSVMMKTTKTASGAVIDGYVDNVLLAVNVPEPDVAVGIGLACGMWLLIRRRSPRVATA